MSPGIAFALVAVACLLFALSVWPGGRGGVSLEIHLWRGFGPTVQHDLFFYGFRFGIFTVSVCKVCVIDSYKTLRAAIVERIEKDEQQ